MEGTGFESTTAILVDGTPCLNRQFLSPSMMRCKTPAHKSGFVSVGVSNSNGLSSSLSDGFRYQGAWAWIAGPSSEGSTGGVTPGGRDSHYSWKDLDGNFWVFGGRGYDSNGQSGLLNDLWKFDGEWTRMDSGSALNQLSNYNAVSMKPGSRNAGRAWSDLEGRFWIFGGVGLDASNTTGYLNDLWKFENGTWSWVSGSRFKDQPTNLSPGGRRASASWVDSSGRLWLFGGIGPDQNGAVGALNDLWVFDGANWNWVGGSKLVNSTGSAIFPGARYSSSSWADRDGNFWLYGGYGYDSSGKVGNLGDLWKFDGRAWVQVRGSAADQLANYGAQGKAHSSNSPGARRGVASWADSEGGFWIFGGQNKDGMLSDLWKFNGQDWVWMAGTETLGQSGFYGIPGVPNLFNHPGARFVSAFWSDAQNRLWIFGGFGVDGAGTAGSLADLFLYTP